VVGVRLSLAAITYQPNDLTTHMHGHHEANMGLAGVYSLGLWGPLLEGVFSSQRYLSL
jgi:hypothetical protein